MAEIGGHVFEFVKDLHAKIFNRTVCRDFAKNAKDSLWKYGLFARLKAVRFPGRLVGANAKVSRLHVSIRKRIVILRSR